MELVLLVIALMLFMHGGNTHEEVPWYEQARKNPIMIDLTEEDPEETITQEEEGLPIEDLILMAKVVYAEANNQDMIGKRLVVDVILNRVDHEAFPNTIKDVVMQENQFSTPGEYNEECMKAVEKEVEERLDEEVVFFRTEKYHSFGNPAYIHGDHYFSYYKEVEE